MNNPTSTGSGGGVETDASSKHQLEKPVDTIEVWIKPLKTLWNDLHCKQDLYEEPELTKQDFQNCLQEREDQLYKKFYEALSSMDCQVHHSFVLEVIDHSQNLHIRSPDTLAYLILRKFDTMLSVKKMTKEELTRILTPELRIQAFHLAASAHSNVFDILSKLYYLQAPDNSLLEPSVRGMLEKKEFKEAATCVTKLNLHNCFSLEDICLPLIFQDKANVVERYVEGFPKLQEALVRQLDAFCEQGFDMTAYLSKMESSVPGVMVHKLKRRHMIKLVLRLVKMFKLDMSICPNTAKSEDISATSKMNMEQQESSKSPQERPSVAEALNQIFILAGILGTCSKKKNNRVIVAYLVMSIVAAILAAFVCAEDGIYPDIAFDYSCNDMRYKGLTALHSVIVIVIAIVACAICWGGLSCCCARPSTQQIHNNPMFIFQDKALKLEGYFEGFPELQEDLVRQLDAFCEQGFDMKAYRSEMNISGPGMRVQKLTKLIRRLVKMFELDMSICPNTAKSEIISAIKCLIHERYSKKSMAQDGWEELILSTIGDNKSVQLCFIKLVENKDVPAAARWARHYEINVNQLTEAVSEELQRSDASNAAREEQGTCRVEKNWDEELPDAPNADYYPLNLPGERIILVSTAVGIKQCLADITKPNRIVGIDMEWRPSFSPTQKSKVALCQIATDETAYLLDMPALWVPETKDIVKSFFQRLLQSKDILKLGFGISGDYEMLGHSFPELQEALKGKKRTVDVGELGKQILKEIPRSGNSRIGSHGLTDLVHFCFGKYLDKRDRISDWERRPLRQAQMTYAALDAFCLLEIYAYLNEKVSDHGLQINMELWNSSKTNKSKSKSPQERPSVAEALNEPPSGPQIDACDLAVVCDNMLEGLGQRLSEFGVDVKVLGNGDEHEEAVQISLKERRAILTTGAPYLKLKSRVDDGQIMCVETHQKAFGQVRDVLKFFKVLIPSYSIYYRFPIELYVDLSMIEPTSPPLP